MKRLRLNNTLTRTREDVFAADGDRLRFYCCGPTVYGPAHIGNFRTFLVQDLFRRVVELTGLPTNHVRNITDVDDKTIRESQAAGETLLGFTRRWTERFHADAKALNLLEPHVEPRATDHIAEQITLIETLIEKGNAYRAEDGSVYFGVSSYEPYGKLTRIDQRELKAGASESANDSDEYDKDNVADFALWKARKDEDGDNFWESPWGEGRPGWHLECSAMGMKYLGESFDLHSGGVDLCFPHHENEIAQSEACTGAEFTRHWFHSEHLMVEGQKMSKSLGNLYTLADLQERGFTAGEMRYAMLSGSYRTKINFSFDRMTEARGNLQRIADFAAKLGGELPAYEELTELAVVEKLDFGPFAEAWDAMLEDLNAAGALGKVFTVLKKLEKADLSDAEAEAARVGLAGIVHAFGWLLPEPSAPDDAAEVPEEIRALAEQRLAAKADKNWADADRLRDELKDAGWIVKDVATGYELEPV